jgi:hypothetical protein
MKILGLEIQMNRIKLSWILAVLLFAGMAFGQIGPENVFPFKDMVFPQVAAGGGYESWITVTNRGSDAWNGDLKLYNGIAVPWNPVVNNVPMVNGTRSISVIPGATKTFKITSPGATETGYAMIKADDKAKLTNFLEGNLSYYLSSGGLVTDSVGVPPAQQFEVSSLPFEDFNSICLALVNSDLAGRPADLKLKLYSDTNVQVGETVDLPLTNGKYSAQYLYQIFPSVALSRGRLEIASDIPVSGIAITQAPGDQFSSLPLNSTTRTYSLMTPSASGAEFGNLTLWSESFFMKGYLEFRYQGHFDWSLFAVSGQIVDGKLHLHLAGSSIDGEFFGYFKSAREFTLGELSFRGLFYWAETPDSLQTMDFSAVLVP